MIIYLLICAISIFMGLGILHLIGVRIDRRTSLYLAPVIALVFWTIFLGWGVLFGFAIKKLWIVGWSITFLIALIGIIREEYSFLKSDWELSLAIISLPVFIMFPYFFYGITIYPGSWFWDGWAYVAFGQYLWQYPRGTVGDIAPIYQYASQLSNTRFIAAALLAFFSPIAGTLKDAQAASGIFLAWTLFVFSSACLSFAYTIDRDSKKIFLLLYVSITVFSGWMLNMLTANNYDNALAISFLPAFAAIIYAADPLDKRWAFVLAGAAAGIIFCYPEMMPVVLFGAFIFFIQKALSARRLTKDFFLLFFGTVLITVLITAPYIKILVSFMHGQVNAAFSQGERPGEGYFPALLDYRCSLPAFLGFNSPFEVCPSPLKVRQYLNNSIAIILSIVGLFGLTDIFRRKFWGFGAFIILLVCGTLTMLLRFGYTYGAYKFILLNWWGIAFSVSTGAYLIYTKYIGTKYRRPMYFCLFMPAFVGLILVSRSVISFDKHYVNWKKSTILRPVQGIKTIVGDEPVLIDIEDSYANLWAVYYLRELNIHLLEYRVYMAQPHIVSQIDRTKLLDFTKVKYILTGEKGIPSSCSMTSLWASGPYRLWKIPNEKCVLAGTPINPNGVEVWNGEQGFWMGKGETRIRLVSSYNGNAFIKGQFTLGPSLPAQSERHILISTDHGFKTNITIEKNGLQVYSIPVISGINWLTMKPLDEPGLTQLPNNETRPLLVGVQGLAVMNGESIAFTIDNPNGIESWGGVQAFWIGKGETDIQIVSPRQGEAVLTAQFIIGPSLPEKSERQLLISTDHKYQEEIKISKDGLNTLRIPVVAGLNHVMIRPLDIPTLPILPNGDSRPLLLGIKDLHLQIE